MTITQHQLDALDEGTLIRTTTGLFMEKEVDGGWYLGETGPIPLDKIIKVLPDDDAELEIIVGQKIPLPPPPLPPAPKQGIKQAAGDGGLYLGMRIINHRLTDDEIREALTILVGKGFFNGEITDAWLLGDIEEEDEDTTESLAEKLGLG